MASLATHRAHAVLSAAVDGLSVGGVEAALDLPARSAARRRLYVALMAAASADTVAHELPALRRAFRGMPLEPTLPADRAVVRHRGVASGAWGVAVAVVHGPVARVLRRRGAARPHLLIGLVAGVGTAATTFPVRWRRAAERAAEDRAAAELDQELAELLAQSAP